MSSSSDLLSNPPCFRSGLMWGIGTGLLIGTHRYRTTKRVRAACDWAVLTFGIVASGSWIVCRATHQARVQQMRNFMEVMNDPNRKAEAEQFLRSRIEEADSKPASQA
ncbi:TPA: hypothetical protein N0F65_007688 [Lagenidium giganteum]|uniref:Cytochrome c oxidase assembly protein COX20, mitochondrial n=1 Tax=Lagenidium giganteum TaxID=4803 RepID=A0AAV2Z4J1_9STRA|nr:TPA: hypothetical protein N0F65_007688 [Lagenidium giganteum]